jgi:hypothetical protein
MTLRPVTVAAAILQAAVVLTAPVLVAPGADAAAVVEVDVVVRDVNGEPIRGVVMHTTSHADGSTLNDRFRTDLRGDGTFLAYEGSVAEIRMVRGFGAPTYPAGWGRTRYVGGVLDALGVDHQVPAFDVDGADGYPDPVHITLPALETRTLRVVTRGDRQPVANVKGYRFGAVSTPVPGLDPETRISPPDIGLLTDYSGRARVTTYTMEPDSQVAEEWSFLPRGDDGKPEVVDNAWGLLYGQGWQYGRRIDYSVWAAQPTTTVTVGYVPFVTDARAEPGRRIGTVRVSARAMQGYGAGSGVPPEALKGIKAYLVMKPTKSAPRELATATTDNRGRVVFAGVTLRGRTRLVVAIDYAHVPARVFARPRR